MDGYGYANQAEAKSGITSAVDQRNWASTASAPAPAPALNIVDVVDAAGSALQRLHGVAENLEAIGDKLVGAVPQKEVNGSTGGASGSLGQLASFLSMIHATIGRIESGATRLHNIHG